MYIRIRSRKNSYPEVMTLEFHGGTGFEINGYLHLYVLEKDAPNLCEDRKPSGDSTECLNSDMKAKYCQFSGKAVIENGGEGVPVVFLIIYVLETAYSRGTFKV